MLAETDISQTPEKINPLKKQIHSFLFVGLLVLIVDYLVYISLVELFDLNFTLSKSTAYLAGTLTSYLLNKFITFSQKKYLRGEFIKFLFLYIVTFFANVAINNLALNFTSENIILSYVVATGISTVLNFVGQKWWVFRSSQLS